jgi:hypothetical protein
MKNGQKKCPIPENPGTFMKPDFPKNDFRPECSYFQNFNEKTVSIIF